MSSDEGDQVSRRIERALASGEPVQTRDALRELDDRRRRGEDVRVAFPGAHIIDIVGPGPDEEFLITFCRLVRDSGTFVPPLSWKDIIRIGVDAMLRHGGGQSAHDVAMDIKVDDFDPVGAARQAIWWIWERGLHNQREREAAARFVSYLLDGREEVRQSVLDALRPWPDEADFAYVVYQLLPQLSERERARLIENDS